LTGLAVWVVAATKASLEENGDDESLEAAALVLTQASAHTLTWALDDRSPAEEFAPTDTTVDELSVMF
jgi:hypothetical protein